MTTFPALERPEDVPAARDWLVRKFRPGAALSRIDGRFVHEVARGAALWWVEEETCHLLAESAPTWPADKPLTFDDMPTPAGLAVFAHEMVGTDSYPSHGGQPIIVSAMMWGPVRLPPHPLAPDRVGIGIGMFSRINLAEGFSQADLGRAAGTLTALIVHGELEPGFYHAGGKQASVLSYLGRTDWCIGDSVEHVQPDNPNGENDITQRSMAEDRRLLAALWAITQTPVVTTVRTKPPKHIARQSERKGLTADVRVLRLGGPRRENIVTGEVRPTTWKHSWIVRPHWRWQAHGPGRSERKLILVGPYRKGPEDMPLLGAERVWRVVPPEGA